MIILSPIEEKTLTNFEFVFDLYKFI